MHAHRGQHVSHIRLTRIFPCTKVVSVYDFSEIGENIPQACLKSYTLKHINNR